MEVKDSDIWDISKLVINHHGLVYHQINSYDDFIENGIPTILENNRRIEVSVTDPETNEIKSCTVEFENIHFAPPIHKENNEDIDIVTPKECVDRDITYKANMYISYVLTNTFGANIVHSNEYFGSIPVMVKSKLCNLKPYERDRQALAKLKENVNDPGGYFIIKGKPKAISSQERTAYNIVYVFRNRKSNPKFELFSEIRSSSKERTHSTTVQIGYLKDKISVVVPYIESGPIPLGIIFKALGVVEESNILKVIWKLFPKEYKTYAWYSNLTSSLEDSYYCKSQDDALYYIGCRGKKFSTGGQVVNFEDVSKEIASLKRKEAISYARHLLSKEFIPHVGHDFNKKVMYVSYMIKKLLYVKMGITEPEDRDHFGNKRIATVGVLFLGQFYHAFRRIRSDITESIERDLKYGATINIRSYIKPKIMVSAFENALSSNIWGASKINGVSQTFDCFNYISMLVNLRKTVTPMSKDGGKIDKPRKLHPSQYGVECPGGTPEGKKCLTLDTEIMTPTGSRLLGVLMDGDEVITIDPITFQISTTTIYDFFTAEKDVYKITLEGNHTIEASEDHPFLCKYVTIPYIIWGTIVATTLQVGAYIGMLEGIAKPVFKKIISIEYSGKKQVADFTTESPNHSFIANRMVTHNCGFIKDLALQAIITIGSDPQPMIELVKNMDITHDDLQDDSFDTLIFANGSPISFTPQPEEFTKRVRQMRRAASISPEISILHKKISNEIYISTDAGRVMYPALIVENGKLKIPVEVIHQIQNEEWENGDISGWSRLFSSGYIEMLDKIEEEETLQVAHPSDLSSLSKSQRNKITHCTLDPVLINSVCASIIPKSDSNQAPRNSYQTSMGKQAIGIPETNWQFHTKGKKHILDYPQKQIVHTKTAELIGLDVMAFGQNAIVAVCPMQGFGQEDSIIMNKDSLDRGFMSVTTLIGFECKVRKDKGEQFEIPSIKECNNFKGNISKLDPDLFYTPIGTKVTKGDILIGMTRKFDQRMTIYNKGKTNHSIIYDQYYDGIVHNVQRGTDGKGYEFINVIIAQKRIPEFGDKFAGVAGQKGTVGMIYPSTDLPFTDEGIAPDIIINPLCLPSQFGSRD